jgi:uncharacterized protein (TIGR03067 family)
VTRFPFSPSCGDATPLAGTIFELLAATTTYGSAMNTVAIALFVFTLIPIEDNAKKALEAIQGDWTIVELLREGTDYKNMVTETEVTLTGEKFIVTYMTGERKEVYLFTIDAKAEPKRIDLPELGKGIYKLEKDKLTICWAIVGERPKEFKSTAKPPTGLLVLERVKK